MKLMETKNQTALEWLVEEISKTNRGKAFLGVYVKEIKEAESTEKQQIINAVDGYPLDKRHLEGEDYYTEIYGKNSD